MTIPTLSVLMDTGDILNGAALDNPVTANLDTAILEYSTPAYANDITPYVRDVQITRGAQRELQRVEAGTGGITLDNRDGRFTPSNSSSPYFPGILPMRRIRIAGSWPPASLQSVMYDGPGTYDSATIEYGGAGTAYPIFMAFVESWPISFPGDADQISSVALVDGLDILANANVSGNFPVQLSGARVSAILAAAAWPSPETAIDVGTVTVPAITLANVSALEHIQRIEVAEGGRFFIARDGKATFRNRGAEVNPDFTNRTWADDGSGMSYRDPVLTFDRTMILNDIHLQRAGGVEQVVISLDSQQHYGIRSYSDTDVQLTSDADVLALANFYLGRFAQPIERFEQLSDNAMKHGLWDRVLSREINELVKASESKTGNVQVSTIEGLSHDIGVDTWVVRLSLSPSTAVKAGVLDDAIYGNLDSTAILAAP